MTIYYDYIAPPQWVDPLLKGGEVVSEYTVDADTFGGLFDNGISLEFTLQYPTQSTVSLQTMSVKSAAGDPLLLVTGLDLVMTESTTEQEVLQSLFGKSFEITFTSGDDLLVIDPIEDELHDFDTRGTSVLLDGEEGDDTIRFEGLYLASVADSLRGLTVSSYQYVDGAISILFEGGAQVSVVAEGSGSSFSMTGEDASGSSFLIQAGEQGSQLYFENAEGSIVDIRNFENLLFEDYLFSLTDTVVVAEQDGSLSVGIGTAWSQYAEGIDAAFTATLSDGMALPDWLSIDPDSGALTV